MLGNFVNRNLSFINKKFAGLIKEAKIDEEIQNKTKESYKTIGNYFEKGEIRNATNSIIEYINLANKYYDSREPWLQVKENMEEFNNTTYTCLYMMANMANMIQPILPNASKKIKKMLNLEEYKWEEEIIKGDYKVENLEIIYEKYDEKEINID